MQWSRIHYVARVAEPVPAAHPAHLPGPGAISNVPVLAEKAAHIAAAVPMLNTRVPGRKWFNGFFRWDQSVMPRERRNRGCKVAAAIHANETKTTLAILDVAMPRAKITVDASIWIAVPPLRFVQRSSLFENRERSHAPSR